jgi:hypothetical protein
VGINHFIYTTHSHSAERNKYRVVIETNREMVKGQLKPTIKLLMDTLDMDIKLVKEMATWSQPWYYPRSDHPKDYMFYEWYEGDAFGVMDPKPDQSFDRDTFARSWGTRFSEIKEGKTYHDNLRDAAWALIKSGVDPDMAVEILIALMESVPDNLKDERWQHRTDEIKRVVFGAVSKLGDDVHLNEFVDVEIPEVPEFENKIIPLPAAPGLLGELMEVCYEMMYFQYREMAFVSTMGLLAGMCGRKFNIKDQGLNLYMTLIMGTGRGKDFIRQWIRSTLQHCAPPGVDSSSFCRMVRATGPVGIANSLKEARSQVAVFSEAGLMLRSRAGDQDGLTRMLLNLYSLSGREKYSGSEEFSSAANSIQEMRAPALTIINEATPETLLQAFTSRGSLDSGELPRQSIFRVIGKKPYLNEGFDEVEIPAYLIKRLREIYVRCAKVQAQEDPEAYIMKFDSHIISDAKEFSRMLTDYENAMESAGDPIKEKMASRAYVKAMKFSALACVFNYEKDLLIHKPEWEWAKAMVQYELDSVDQFFSGGAGGFSELETLARQVVGPTIIKMISGRYKADILDTRPVKAEFKKGIFRKTGLAQILKGNARVAAFNDDAQRSNPVNGLSKALGHMMSMGYIEAVKTQMTGVRDSGVYRITDTFKVLFKDAVS